MEAAVPQSRFDVEALLGEGGMGMVYAVWDRARGQRVALKTLRELDPTSALRFKQEFRTVLDLRHPNLVTLGELIENDGRLMFTMELVAGIDFRRFVSHGSVHAPAPEADSTVRAIDPAALREFTPVTSAQSFDAARLRGALAQLALALAHLHEAGVVHRDIKPSNVLVADGRVVLLDFGVASRTSWNASHELTGTPDYLAPEMLSGKVGTASDLYAVGVMLYEALTGSRPFGGTPSLVIAEKAARDPMRPSLLRPDIPEDLDALAVALLSRDPAARPCARALHAALTNAPLTMPRRPQTGFVGRDHVLDALSVAYERALTSGPVLLTLEGQPGLGKTALLAAFASSFEGVSLAGRCRQEETIPYRAFDGVVDALSGVITREPKRFAQAHEALETAATMFPVLAHLAWPNAGAQRVLELGEARRRAFSAVRALLTVVANELPLIVCIDDAHWFDDDDAALLDAILDADEAPRALFLLAHRPVSTTSALATALRRLEGRIARDHIVLEPLTRDASRALLAASAPRAHEEDLARVADASDGNPFTLVEIARALASGRSDLTSFEALLSARISALADDPRRLLETLAVAGYPVHKSIASRAADVSESTYAALLERSFVKRGGLRGPDTLEIAHARVREHVMATLDAQHARDCHARLALAIEDAGLDEPDHLAEHLAAAGLDHRAGPYARLASSRAEHALAFDRAARFLSISLSDPSLEDDARRTTRIRLGEALARIGRGRASADAFLAAGDGADEADWLALRQRASEELLITGHLEDGLALLRGVLDDVGLEGASNPWTALPAIAIESTRLALRGLEFEVKTEAEWPRKLRLRADACLAAARALSIVDTIKGSAFQLRALRLALELGDPYRVLYNVALGAGLAAANEGSRGTSADVHLEAAERTAPLVHDPRGHAFVLMSKGVVAYCRGQFNVVVARTREAEHWLVTRCTYATWELNTTRIFLTLGLAFSGDFSALSRALREYEKDADMRADVYAAGHFRLVARPWLALVAGDVEASRIAIVHAMDAFKFEGYSWAFFYARLHQALLALYEGDIDAADDAIKQIDALPGPILLARFRFHRLLARWVKGRTEVTRLAQSSDRSARRRLRGIIDGIFDEGDPWADGLAHSLDAALCRLDGDEPLATVALRAARDAFASAGMVLFEASATYELARLLGERDEGPLFLENATRTLESLGAREPARIAGLLAGMR